MKTRYYYSFSMVAMLGALAQPASAQEIAAAAQVQEAAGDPGFDDNATEQDEEAVPGEIVVIASRLRGAVDTDIPPVDELNEEEIASYGVSSLTDLVSALAPQTGSGRGRGGGMPVILLNGQRISSFRELRDLPPEAVKQVQVFPEELALKYGFRADQRVMNIILKENFASFNTEFEFARPWEGAQTSKEVEATFTRIGKSSRLNIDLEVEGASRITESERDIIATPSTIPALPDGSPAEIGITDQSPYRTLVPQSERFEINGTWTKQLSPLSSLSLNANYQLSGSESLLGLGGTTFVLPSTSPFNSYGQDVTISRYFDTPKPLGRDSETHTFNTGSTFNTMLNDWRWTVTGEYSHVQSQSRTNRNIDFAALQAGVANGTLDPFAADSGENLVFLAPDLSESTSQNINLKSTLSGSPLTLPAGPVNVTFSSGYNRQMLDSESWRSGVTTTASLRRNVINNNANVELPLVERDLGALGSIGDVSINGNIGVTDVSDFGSLMEYGVGLRWSPFNNLTFQASLLGDENAPSIGQLGDPVVVTPNVSVYDFVRGETVFTNVISGGNPLLGAESRKDIKLSLNWQPKFIKDMNMQVEYFRNRAENVSTSFPLLTPEIEAAFPGRVTRDGSGRIISIDQRPINFAEQKQQQIRWGFNVSGTLGKQPESQEAGQGPGGGPRGGPPGAGRGGNRGPGGGGPRMGGGGRPGFLGGGQMPSRWQLALYHTYRISDEILIAPGVPVLDLLNGSATSSSGGSPRHEFQLSTGIFHKGLGFRLEGNYKTSTDVDGTGLPGSSDLHFGDLATLNAFVFVNLDQQGDLTKKLPFLKNSRVTLRVDNVLNDYVDVRDQNGDVPLSYQPGYQNPRGRVFEVSFRKSF